MLSEEIERWGENRHIVIQWQGTSSVLHSSHRCRFYVLFRAACVRSRVPVILSQSQRIVVHTAEHTHMNCLWMRGLIHFGLDCATGHAQCPVDGSSVPVNGHICRSRADAHCRADAGQMQTPMEYHINRFMNFYLIWSQFNMDPNLPGVEQN